MELCAQHLLLLFVLRGKNHITLVFVIGSMVTTVDEDEWGRMKSADRGNESKRRDLNAERADVSHIFTYLTASVCADNLPAGIT